MNEKYVALSLVFIISLCYIINYILMDKAASYNKMYSIESNKLRTIAFGFFTCGISLSIILCVIIWYNYKI